MEREPHVLGVREVDVGDDDGLDELEVLLLRPALLAAVGEGVSLLAGDELDLKLGEVHRALLLDVAAAEGEGAVEGAVEDTSERGSGRAEGGGDRRARGEGLATGHGVLRRSNSDVIGFVGRGADDGGLGVDGALGDAGQGVRLDADGGTGGDRRRHFRLSGLLAGKARRALPADWCFNIQLYPSSRRREIANWDFMRSLPITVRPGI